LKWVLSRDLDSRLSGDHESLSVGPGCEDNGAHRLRHFVVRSAPWLAASLALRAASVALRPTCARPRPADPGPITTRPMFQQGRRDYPRRCILQLPPTGTEECAGGPQRGAHFP